MAAAFNLRGSSLPLGAKTYVMGILNATPDSFSDGGLYNTPSAALRRALEMQEQGADIIDIGANSTRPGAVILSESEECERIEPFLASIGGKLSAAISADTFYPACAALALRHGAAIINDVSGRLNPEMVDLCRKYGAALIVTHNPCGADGKADYKAGVVDDVKAFFCECIKNAALGGLPAGSLCLDIGLGFGKTAQQNFELIRRLGELKTPGVALLTGASRKRFVGEAAGIEKPDMRDAATVAVHTAAIAGGADIIRVHNVAAGVSGARAADTIYRR